MGDGKTQDRFTQCYYRFRTLCSMADLDHAAFLSVGESIVWGIRSALIRSPCARQLF